APFDDHCADVILRSSDGVDFHVYGAVLSLASPGFRETLQSLAHPNDRDAASVTMGESAVVLDRMLRFFYPGAEPVLTNLETLREILDGVLLKYGMRFLAPLGKRYLRSFIEAMPVGVYSVACRYEWKDVATEAARHSLRLPIRAFRLAPAQLQYITADRYHALLKYHTQCSEAAEA
ncbi:hypothetical protein B0H17DRAFT_863431, partial [Mycena rosella]